LGQGRIIGPRPATLRINPIGSRRAQLSGHLSGKDGIGPPSRDLRPRFRRMPVTVLRVGLLDGGGDHRVHGLLEIGTAIDGLEGVKPDGLVRGVDHVRAASRLLGLEIPGRDFDLVLEQCPPGARSGVAG
jgi:hypothetical protein